MQIKSARIALRFSECIVPRCRDTVERRTGRRGRQGEVLFLEAAHCQLHRPKHCAEESRANAQSILIVYIGAPDVMLLRNQSGISGIEALGV